MPGQFSLERLLKYSESKRIVSVQGEVKLSDLEVQLRLEMARTAPEVSHLH